MNYKSMLKGALAFSLSLIVESASAANTTYTDTPLYGATFESATSAVEPLNDYAYATNTLVTTYTSTEGGATYGWLGAAEDESKIIAANGGQALQLNTDAGTLTNKLAPTAVAAPLNTAIAGAGAYIETEAKFVASDTLDAGVVGDTDDTKFAIYAYADENASPCTTNLVIYHGVMDGNGDVTYTNEVFDTLINTEVYTKIRVEMKKLVDPENSEVSYNVFSVKIDDDDELTSDTALDALFNGTATGKWFLTIESDADDENHDVSSISFKGTGEVDNLAVGTITATTTYAIDWSASQNVIASNLTANAELAAGDTNFVDAVQLAFYPTEGNVITNVLLNGDAIDGVMFPIDSYSYTVNSTDAIITVLAGTQAAPATVFSVATVGNATVTGADGVYTISVPLGNGLSSVYVNGAAVTPTDNGNGTYSIDVSALTGNVNIVVATKKVRTPIGHKWYENPGVIATNLAGKGGQAGPYKFSVGSDFAAISYGNHQAATTGFKLFTVDSLLAGNASPIYNEVVGDTTSLNIYSVRGAAICEALDVALITAYSGGKAFSLPLSTNELELGVNAFEITNDQGITFDRAYFTPDNQYLYTTEVAGGTNTKIAKWAIADGLKGSGQKLTFVEDYTMPSRIRDFAYARINGKDLFYVLQNGTAGVCVYDVAGGTNVQLTAAFAAAADYGSIAVSMTSTATPTLTVLPSPNGSALDPMKVYQLAADGLSITDTLATFTTADLVAAGISAGEYIRSAWPSEDDETLYLGYGNNNLYVLQYVAPPPPPTVISVAKLSDTAAMVGDALPRIGATVTDSNGDAVDPSDYAIDTSAVNMNAAGLYPVVITAAAPLEGVLTNYFAVMNLTWFNGTPTQKALINPQNVQLTAIHFMHTSQDGAYLAVNGDNTNGGGRGNLLYSVATLKSIYGLCQGVWEVAHNTAAGGKGMAANTTSGIMLAGGGTTGGTVGTQSTFKGYDISDLANIGTDTNMVQESYAAEWDGSGYSAGQVIDGLDFNHAGTKVFGNNAGTDGPWVYQLAIDKNAKTMTWEATYTTDFGRVRSVSAYYIDGKDYVFVGEGASSGHGEIAVIDPSDGSITTICVAADDFTTAEFPSGRYFTNVKVSGIASGEMYLYGSTDKGEVVIWALDHDAVTGEWKTAPVGNITSAQTAALNSKASVSNSRAFDVSDDNTAGFLYADAAPGQFAVVTDVSLAQRKALASATLSPASSDKDVALGAITATVLDENGDTVAAAEYTITTNLIDIATVGTYTVTITPVEGSIYSNAVTAVYTISEPAAGYNYPEGGAIEDADVVAWLTTKGFTQAQVSALGTNAKLNECYLLNCDITQSGAGGSITITGITVSGSSVTVTVALSRTGGYTGGINGELKLYGTAALGTAFAELDAATITDADFSEGDTTTATLSGGTAKFFKAVVVAPAAE